MDIPTGVNTHTDSRFPAPALHYICGPEDNGGVLLNVLRDKLGIFTTTLRRLKSGNGIFMNGQPVHVREKLKAGDRVDIDLSAAETPSEIPPEPLELDVVFENAGVLAVNKPATSVVHPTCFHRENTIAAGIVNYYRAHGINAGMHFVNRLDLGTSGLLLCAKAGLIQERLKLQAETGQYTKLYLGVLDTARFSQKNALKRGFRGLIEAGISRDTRSIIKRRIDPQGKPAVTFFKILEIDTAADKALAAFSLATGRTHQIRVHLSGIGLPLTGDSLYAPDCEGGDTHQLLHQYKTNFTDPLDGAPVTIECPVIKEISDVFPAVFHGGLLAGAYAGLIDDISSRAGIDVALPDHVDGALFDLQVRL